MQMFVAVATGQNVANLPPILNFAREGDAVLWLESELARAQGWAAGAVAVLEARGLRNHRQPIKGDINDPDAVQAALRSWLKDRPRDQRLNIVLNGGQKLTPFGLALAARHWREERGGKVRFLYGDDQPVGVQVREARIGSPVRFRRYDAGRMLTFEEVLRASGVEQVHPGEKLKLSDPALPAYGLDPVLTRLVHHYASLPSESAFDSAPWPPFQQWSNAARERFREQLGKKLAAILEQPGGLPREQTERLAASFVRIASEFQPRTRRGGMAREHRDLLAREGWVSGEGEAWRIEWRRLEDAVAGRIVAFLDAHPECRRVVREVRCNPRVAGEAEWDVVLTLLNGIVLHFECKSWGAGRKDLNSRVQVLQRLSSRLARMHVVMPLFPEFADEPWFADMHRQWRGVAAYPGVNTVAFTMHERAARAAAKQRAERYTVEGSRDAFPWPPSFEESLQRILRRYAGAP